MIKQDSGSLACIAERPDRYTLGQLKIALQEAMVRASLPPATWCSLLCADFFYQTRISPTTRSFPQGIAEVKDSTMSKIRDGYRQTTWWEDAAGKPDEASAKWRS